MNVTPLDLRQQRFSRVMRGYDRGEVAAFLSEVADDYEGALRETDHLRQELAKLEAVLSEHRGQDRYLRNTLLSAQRMADEIRDRAQQEAESLVTEAENRANLLLANSQSRLDEVQREIDTLRTKRKDVETALEGIVETLKASIDMVREKDARHRDEKILLHRPRQPETPAASARATEVAEARSQG